MDFLIYFFGGICLVGLLMWISLSILKSEALFLSIFGIGGILLTIYLFYGLFSYFDIIIAALICSLIVVGIIALIYWTNKQELRELDNLPDHHVKIESELTEEDDSKTYSEKRKSIFDS